MALDLQKFILRFIEEAREHLGRLGEGLAQLDAGHSDREGVNALFRSAHTIKGSSRMLRLASITAVAHQVEEVLGSLREGSQTYTPALGQLLYRAVDHLAALVDALAQSGNAASLPPADEALCQALAQAGQPATGPQEEVGQVAAPPVPAAPPQAVPVAIPASAPAPLVGPGAAPAVAPANAPPQLQAAQTVRVRLDKLDGLVKLMGEVVASHARLRQRLADIQALLRELGEAPPPALLVFERQLKDDVQAQEGLMHELHDKTLVMRMLALAIVFEPAARLVRELARSVGKEVECQVSGSEIELDRQLIDQLADPIIHLIRNAVDHGIEPPEVRRAAGKPTQGHVQLSARQDGGWVVIELSDDGAGIALQAVRDKAVKKGLLSADKAAALSDQEAIDLIFLPGFSTSSMITDLSGRGVGMDVVKQTVLDELQGSVSVHTRSGMGTTFSLRLPLSLAMLRVLLVQVQGQAFGFTAQHVAELVRLPRSALLPMAEREAVIVRNEFVPVVALDALLQLPATAGARTPAAPGTAESSMLLVVLQVRHDKIAVCVDSLLDERDMVIQPLPPAHAPPAPGVGHGDHRQQCPGERAARSRAAGAGAAPARCRATGGGGQRACALPRAGGGRLVEHARNRKRRAASLWLRRDPGRRRARRSAQSAGPAFRRHPHRRGNALHGRLHPHGTAAPAAAVPGHAHRHHYLARKRRRQTPWDASGRRCLHRQGGL